MSVTVLHSIVRSRNARPQAGAPVEDASSSSVAASAAGQAACAKASNESSVGVTLCSPLVSSDPRSQAGLGSSDQHDEAKLCSLDVPMTKLDVEQHPLGRPAAKQLRKRRLSSFLGRRDTTNGDGGRWRSFVNYFQKGVFFEDPKYEENVFLTSKRMGSPYLVAFSKAKSLHYFSMENRFRRFTIHLATNEFFDYLIILTILINCVLLAMNNGNELAELLFASLYTLEMVLKIIAFGFFHHRLSYLRNPWNVLDFVVVVFGWMTLIPGLSNFSTIRAFRVLRALRTINALPGLRIMVTSVLSSLKALGDVFILMLFFLFVSSVLGLQLFRGNLLQKCVLPDDSDPTFTNMTASYGNESTPINHINSSYWLKDSLGDFIVCGNSSSATSCPAPSVCLGDIGQNPNHGYTSFDHFGFAFLTSIQLFTLDYWENVYILIIAASGAAAVIFFYFVVFGGAFYTLNLVLAVVTLSYNKASEGEVARDLELLDAAQVAYNEEASLSSRINLCPPESATSNDSNSGNSGSGGANSATATEPPVELECTRARPTAGSTAKPSLAPPTTSLLAPSAAPAAGRLPTMTLSPLDPPRPPMEDSPYRRDRRVSAPPAFSLPPTVHGEVTEDKLRQEARQPKKPSTLHIPSLDSQHARLGQATQAVAADETSSSRQNEPSPRPSNALPAASTDAKQSESGLALPSLDNVFSEQSPTVKPPSQQLTILPPILSDCRLPDMHVRTPTRFGLDRALTLPVTPEDMSLGTLPPVTLKTPASQAIVRDSSPSPKSQRQMSDTSLPGQTVTPPLTQHEPPCLDDPDSTDDDLSPLPAAPSRTGGRRESTTSAGAGPTLHSQLSSASGAMFTKRSVSSNSGHSRSSSLTFDLRPAPLPLPPTVFVQDEDENVVEAVRVRTRRRLSHHVDQVLLPVARRTAKFVKSTQFEILIMLCIALNTALLAIEHPFMDPDLSVGLCSANLALGTVFLIEAILKMLSYGLKNYFRVAWNVFDFLIVLFSIIEFILMAAGSGICSVESSNIATVFRAFRLLRVLKMAQSWSTMRSLLAIIANSIKDLGYLTLVMGIILCTFALVGMHLFQPYYTTYAFAPDPIPRWNFTDFGNSLMVIFRIVCGEWIEPLYDTMRASSPAAAIFYLIVLAVGNFLILNLFLALLLNSFDVEQIRQSKSEEVKSKSFAKRLKKAVKRLNCCRRQKISPKTRRRSRHNTLTSEAGEELAQQAEKARKAPVESAASTGNVRKPRPENTSGVSLPDRANVRKNPPTNIATIVGAAANSDTLTYTHKQESSASAVRIDIGDSSPRPSRQSECSTRTLLMAENSERTVDELHVRKRNLSESSTGGVPTLTLTPMDMCDTTTAVSAAAVRTVETHRLSLEEQTINDAGKQEVRLSVTETRTRSSSFSSERSATNLAVVSSVDGGKSSVSLQPSQARIGSVTSNSRTMRQTAAGGNPQRGSIGGGGGGGDGDQCCTCITSHRCCHLWCLCAFTPKRTMSGADEVEMVRLDPTSGRAADPGSSGDETRRRGCKHGCVSFWRKCQELLGRIVSHSYFDNIILVLVIFSSISLAFEDSTVEKDSPRDNILQTLNIVFTALFTAELLVKNVGLGPRTYFSSPWNWLDAIIVLVSLASLDYTGDNSNESLSALRALRTLRCLRPLRTISRWNGMKAVVNALLKSIPGISNVLLVCFIIWLIFSILGVQFFGGLFYKCMVDGERVSHTIVANKNECISLYNEEAWVNSPQNFDNVFNAALSLFQVATFEGWIELMADAVDATGLNRQPIYDNNFAANLYFVVFIIIGSFFVLNLFIGVIIDSFARIKRENENQPTFSKFLTPSQQAWIKTWKKMADRKPIKTAKPPKGRVRRFFYKILDDPRFEVALMLTILANGVLIATEHHNQSKTWMEVQFYLNLTLTTFYILEATVKIYTWRKAYFQSGWNLFDLLIIMLGIAGNRLVLELYSQNFGLNPSFLRMARLVRIVRVLRLVRRMQGLRRLLFTLMYSLPALINVGALLILTIYIYSILGMSVFGHVKRTGVLSDQINFEDFPHAFLVLFRVATAAGWNEVLYGLMVQPPFCDPSYKGLPNGNCGRLIVGPLYLGSFVMISYLIVVNMYIAIVLENFAETEEVGLGDSDLETFYEAWTKFDPAATQFIPFYDIQRLIRAIPRPLGIPAADLKTIAALDIPLFKDDENDMMVAHCLDVMDALVRRVLTKALGDMEDSTYFAEMMQQTQEKFNEKFPNRSKIKPVSSSGEMVHATIALQKAVRRFLSAKRLRREAEAIAEEEATSPRKAMVMSAPLAAVLSPASPTTAVMANTPGGQHQQVFDFNLTHHSAAQLRQSNRPQSASSSHLRSAATTSQHSLSSRLEPDTTRAKATGGGLLGVADTRSSRAIAGRAAGIIRQDYSTSTRELYKLHSPSSENKPLISDASTSSDSLPNSPFGAGLGRFKRSSTLDSTTGTTSRPRSLAAKQQSSSSLQPGGPASSRAQRHSLPAPMSTGLPPGTQCADDANMPGAARKTGTDKGSDKPPTSASPAQPGTSAANAAVPTLCVETSRASPAVTVSCTPGAEHVAAETGRALPAITTSQDTTSPTAKPVNLAPSAAVRITADSSPTVVVGKSRVMARPTGRLLFASSDNLRSSSSANEITASARQSSSPRTSLTSLGSRLASAARAISTRSLRVSPVTSSPHSSAPGTPRLTRSTKSLHSPSSAVHVSHGDSGASLKRSAHSMVSGKSPQLSRSGRVLQPGESLRRTRSARTTEEGETPHLSAHTSGNSLKQSTPNLNLPDETTIEELV